MGTGGGFWIDCFSNPDKSTMTYNSSMNHQFVLYVEMLLHVCTSVITAHKYRLPTAWRYVRVPVVHRDLSFLGIVNIRSEGMFYCYVMMDLLNIRWTTEFPSDVMLMWMNFCLEKCSFLLGLGSNWCKMTFPHLSTETVIIRKWVE